MRRDVIVIDTMCHNQGRNLCSLRIQVRIPIKESAFMSKGCSEYISGVEIVEG